MKGWLLLFLIMVSCSAQAELVVIVNANRDIEHLSHEEVVNIFMGRYRKLPDGSLLQPLDLKGEAPERQAFYEKLLGKNLAEINAYWARLIFSGRTSPPVALNTPEEVLKKVAHDPNAIGYADSNYLNRQVKVVYKLDE